MMAGMKYWYVMYYITYQYQYQYITYITHSTPNVKVITY